MVVVALTSLRGTAHPAHPSAPVAVPTQGAYTLAAPHFLIPPHLTPPTLIRRRDIKEVFKVFTEEVRE
jgi:hypothetical protein